MKPFNTDSHPAHRGLRLCLALPEAAERLSHGEPVWFVQDKRLFVMFADHHHDDRSRPAHRQRERFFVAHAPDAAFARDGWTDDERVDICDMPRWSLNEIAASEETFAPRRLAEPLLPILKGEYPGLPLVTGD